MKNLSKEAEKIVFPVFPVFPVRVFPVGFPHGELRGKLKGFPR